MQVINDSKNAIDWAVSARIDSARENFVKSHPKEKERKQKEREYKEKLKEKKKARREAQKAKEAVAKAKRK